MLDGLLARLAEEPRRAALVFDVDGTLAPIVERPSEAAVPHATRTELERLTGRYALVAFVSGRTAAEAARIVGLSDATYAGVHGLELEPAARDWTPRLRELARAAAWPEQDLEDKGVAIAFHYRRAADPAAAHRALEGVAEEARAAGLEARFGRKVLEVRAPVAADKGTALRRLLADIHVDRALYAGDDTTDLDAFRGLDEAGLELAVKVAIDSPEAPPELLSAADVVVPGTDALVRLLARL